MFSMKKMDHHLDLLGHMAETLGIDLNAAMRAGRLSPETYRAAALRCTGCDAPEACAHWQRDHRAGAAAAPDYCRNANLLAALKEAAP